MALSDVSMLIPPNTAPNLSYRAPAMRLIWLVFYEMNHRASYNRFLEVPLRY